jgi:hypothetical protein
MSDEIAKSIDRLADSITPFRSAPGHDKSGGYVASLTEAVMGVTAGLCEIAEAIHRLADVMEKRN